MSFVSSLAATTSQHLSRSLVSSHIIGFDRAANCSASSLSVSPTASADWVTARRRFDSAPEHSEHREIYQSVKFAEWERAICSSRLINSHLRLPLSTTLPNNASRNAERNKLALRALTQVEIIALWLTRGTRCTQSSPIKRPTRQLQPPPDSRNPSCAPAPEKFPASSRERHAPFIWFSPWLFHQDGNEFFKTTKIRWEEFTAFKIILLKQNMGNNTDLGNLDGLLSRFSCQL